MRNQVIGVVLRWFGISTVLAVPFITCAQAQTRAIAPNSPQALAMSRSYGKLPLSFEANRGQTDARVQFLARGEGFTLFLAGDQAILKLQSGKSSEVSSTALFMSLVGSSQNISASAEDRLPGHSNYLMGSDPAKWLRNLETYRKVR